MLFLTFPHGPNTTRWILPRTFISPLVIKSTRTRIYACTQAIIRGNHRWCLFSFRSSLPSSLLFQYWFNFRLFNRHISSSCRDVSVWVKLFWFKDQQSLVHHFSSHCHRCFFLISFQPLLIHTCVYIDCLYKNKGKGWRESACCD